MYKLHRGNLEYFITFIKLRAELRRIVLKAKRKVWEDYVRNLKPNTKSGSIWKIIKATIILRQNNEVISDPDRVVNAMAQYFAGVSSDDSGNALFREKTGKEIELLVTFLDDNSEDYNKPIVMVDLKQTIETTKSKSAGQDNIPYMFYKNFNEGHLKQLLEVYNFVFNSGIPQQWREAIVIPIRKPNKVDTKAKSYRPIVLTNCMGKLLEKILNWRLQYFVERNRLYDSQLRGFRASRSTLDALTVNESNIRETLMLYKYMLTVFLDVSHAFDAVWYQQLLQKIRIAGIKGNMTKYIKFFLNGSSIKVSIKGRETESYPMLAGVPQGLVLSPTLFTI